MTNVVADDDLPGLTLLCCLCQTIRVYSCGRLSGSLSWVQLQESVSQHHTGDCLLFARGGAHGERPLMLTNYAILGAGVDGGAGALFLLTQIALGLPDLPYFTWDPVYQPCSPTSKKEDTQETESPVFDYMPNLQALWLESGFSCWGTAIGHW